MAYRDDDSRAKGEGPVPQVEQGSSATPAPQPVEAAAPKRKSGFGKKAIFSVVLLGALGFGAYEGNYWWNTGRFLVSTDDAYVQADITILSAKVSGYVSTVSVANNQSVKAGDLIAKIDDGDYRLALQATKDKLATQQSTVDRIGRQIEAAKASVAQADAQVAAARADADRAASEFARQQQLAQSNYASTATYETAKADRDRADANVKSAQAALTLAQANVDVLSAQQTEARRGLAEQQTAVDKAERDLSFTEIRAPVDGVIGNKAVEVGTFLQPGARLAAIVPLTNVHVDANFKETQLASLKPGMKTHIEVDAFPDADIVGTVESVSPASGAVFSLLPPDNATGNFTKIVQRVPVRIAVSDGVAAERILRPGLSVLVSVDTRDGNGPQGSKTAQR